MATLLSLSSDSDDSELEVLQQLSDWDCEELAYRKPSRLCEAAQLYRTPSQNGDRIPNTHSKINDDSTQPRNNDSLIHNNSSVVENNDIIVENNDLEVQFQPPRRRRRHRRLENMHSLNDAEFMFRFRLNKSAVEELLTEIMPYVQVTSRRNNGVALLHQLLLTLRFYALGQMLSSVADFVGVSKSSASRILQQISAAIARLYDKYIVMHENSTLKFYRIAQFPRVLGAIDCTHVRIQSPTHIFGDEFKNQEGYYSLNVQAVCDADLRFINVVARWPGSIDDDTILDNSLLKTQCEGGAFGNQWLLGDFAYPNRAYLLTPIMNPVYPNEQRYNEAHYKTWNTIGRTFGLWKRRFPVMALTLRLGLPNIQNVIISTAVLYNICRHNNLEEVPSEVELPDIDLPYNMGVGPQNMEVQDFGKRADLINNYFSN